MIINSGLNISISGASNGNTATVASQTPEPGTLVSKGTLVTIEMIHEITSDDL